MEGDFRPGTWVAHRQWGIGQIAAIETRHISGAPAEYYRIELQEGTCWLPASDYAEDFLRPLASPQTVEQALDELEAPAGEMAGNAELRRQRIARVRANYTPRKAMHLIRDLWHRRDEKGLSVQERRALNALIERFCHEWSLSVGTQQEEARQHIFNRLSSDS